MLLVALQSSNTAMENIFLQECPTPTIDFLRQFPANPTVTFAVFRTNFAFKSSTNLPLSTMAAHGPRRTKIWSKFSTWSRNFPKVSEILSLASF